MTYNTETQQKIKAIVYEYAGGSEDWLEITEKQLDEIAYRIEREVMGVADDNEFVGLRDLTKE